MLLSTYDSNHTEVQLLSFVCSSGGKAGNFACRTSDLTDKCRLTCVAQVGGFRNQFVATATRPRVVSGPYWEPIHARASACRH